MEKHAFLILAHKDWNDLIDLLHLLDFPDNDIYLHVNKKSIDFPEKEIFSVCKKAGFYLMPRLGFYSGSPIIVTGVHMCFFSMACPKHYAFYHILSGQCLPIVSNSDLHIFFEKNKGKEFVDFMPISDYIYSRYAYKQLLSSWWAKGGLWKYLYEVLRLPYIYSQKMFRIDRIKKYFPDGCVKKGGAFWSIDDDFAQFLSSKKEEIIEAYRYSFIPDESYIQTFLCSSPFINNLYEDKNGNISSARFILWSEKQHGHPLILTKENEKQIFASGCIFARKFSSLVDNNIRKEIFDNCLKNEGFYKNIPDSKLMGVH
jgi:hypothetical protein